MGQQSGYLRRQSCNHSVGSNCLRGSALGRQSDGISRSGDQGHGIGRGVIGIGGFRAGFGSRVATGNGECQRSDRDRRCCGERSNRYGSIINWRVKATVNVPLAETVICPTTVGIEPPLEAIAVGAPGKFVNPADSAIDDEAWPLKTT